MAYEDDPYRDEDGEPLMDYDDIQSDGAQSPDPHQHRLLDDDALEDDIDGWGEQERERSQTPVYDVDKVGKPRKRLVKKSGSNLGGKESSFVGPELVDEDDEDRGFEREEKRRKKFGKEKEKRKFSGKGEKKFGSGNSTSGGKSKSALMKNGMMYSGKLAAGKDDGEVKEMWDTIAGGDSEVLD